MNPDRQKPNVTLEDLLRLKRAERPPAEFWDQFDRELRAKQLAAIVEPRPWWTPFIRVGARMSRYQLPIGAAAVFALSLVTIREYRTGSSLPEVYTTPAVAAIAASEPVSASVEQPKVEPLTVSTRETMAAVTSPAPMAVTQQTSAPAASVSAPAADAMPNQAPASATFAVLGAGFNRTDDSASARFLGANLPAQPDTEAILSDALTRPSRTLAVRPVREPLTQVTSPREARLARLLSPGLSSTMASNADLTVRTSERVARNLTEDRLYDSMSRINAAGAGVLVKF
ncbi:MAG: hypothetical protein JSS11_13325 [Verrucomicrobia bacterium]|nr:hypothetical protein [Verrucomicrobiota bacterium]